MTATNALIACPECDTLLALKDVEIRHQALCPCCGVVLYQPRNKSIMHTLSLSMTGLILILPANFLPLLSIKLLGNSQEGTLWSGVTGLFQEGLWSVAVLVLLSSIVFPTIIIVLSFLLSVHLYRHRAHRHLALWMRCLQHLEEWAMLEVYMLGIIVACVKLADTTELKFGLGLYAFVSMLVINVLLTQNVDKHLFWQHITKLQANDLKS